MTVEDGKVTRLEVYVEAPKMREALVETVGRALDAVTARDARGFFGTVGTAHGVNYYDRPW